MLELRNPHSVLATLEVRPNAVRSVLLSRPKTNSPWDEVAEAAASCGVKVSVGQHERKRPAGKNPGKRDTERFGAGSAMIEPPSPVPLGNLLRHPDTESRGLLLALDQVQDPQNLGAIFRLAGFFGVKGIILTKDKSAPINATVCDVSTGGVERVPYSIVSNLNQALQKGQKSDFWVLGTCERATESIYKVDRNRWWILVMGNEGDGIRRLTRETCDTIASVPCAGAVPSLNVGAATAACLTALSNPEVTS